jgi:hypothetical protein
LQRRQSNTKEDQMEKCGEQKRIKRSKFLRRFFSFEKFHVKKNKKILLRIRAKRNRQKGSPERTKRLLNNMRLMMKFIFEVEI